MNTFCARLRRFLFLLCLFGGANASPSLTLLVDGVSPLKLDGLLRVLAPGLPAYPAAGYLAVSPLAQALERQGGGRILSLAWNGDPTDGAELRQAADTLEAVLLEASRQGLEVHVIAHSLGSAIATRALAAAAARNDPAWHGVASLITLSSPLGHAGLMATLAGMHPGLFESVPLSKERLGIGRWLNIYSAGDILSRPIDAPEVENLALPAPAQSFPPNPLSLLEAHKQPFKDARAIERILEQLSAGAPPR